jgi:ABC-type glutathione transport system ATPase component
MTNLVEIANLRVVFHGDRGQTMHAVETVNFELARGVTLGDHGASAERIHRRLRACGF